MACSNFDAFSANKSFNGDAIALFKRMYFMSNLVTPKVEQVEQKQSTSFFHPLCPLIEEQMAIPGATSCPRNHIA